MQKKNKIEAANVMSDREYGTRILAKGCEVSEDSFKSRLNGNDLIVGGSGAGKTGSYVTPHLIRLMNSMVVADTKGLLVKKYGDYLRKKGFKVVCIDFVHPERSAHYNILDEVRWYETEAIDEEGKKVKKKKYSQQDLREIARLLIPDGQDDEPFWELSARSVLLSLMAYVLETADEEDRNMDSVISAYEQLSEECFEGNRDRNWPGVSFFELLGKEHPHSFAYRSYRKYKGIFTSEKTWSSIEQFVSNSIEILSFDEMEPFTKHASDIRLADIGRERTVVFVNVSDNRRSMDMMVNIFYTQLFQALMNEADSHEDGKLEVPVRIVLDDFANNVFIPDFDKIISTIRSRQISTSIILQDLSQLEGMYKKAHARTIMSNCDHKIFIGGQDDAETADYVADIAGCLPESVKNLELGKAWIVERGGKPRLCDVVEPYSMDILLKE